MKAVLLFLFISCAISLRFKEGETSSRFFFKKNVTMEQKIEAATAQWEGYKLKFDKKYNETEEKERLEIFIKTVIMIEEHNLKYQAGEVSYEMGINQFTDMTDAEKEMYLDFRRPEFVDVQSEEK